MKILNEMNFADNYALLIIKNCTLKYCLKWHTGMYRLIDAGHIDDHQEPGEYLDPRLFIYIQILFSVNADIYFYFEIYRQLYMYFNISYLCTRPKRNNYTKQSLMCTPLPEFFSS